MFEYRRKAESMSKFYNWFFRFYSSIGKTTNSIALAVMNEILPTINDAKEKNALEYACGTGSLTMMISDYFKMIKAIDSSSGMISVAKKNTLENKNIQFQLGSLLNIDEHENEYDWVFISFALHLFSPQDEELILKKILRVARDGVIIIDHKRKWNLNTAIAEWIEGSYYEKYISIDFREIALKNNVRKYTEMNKKDCFVMIFQK